MLLQALSEEEKEAEEMKVKKKPRRVVLGKGYPWFSNHKKNIFHPYDTLRLYKDRNGFRVIEVKRPSGAYEINREWRPVDLKMGEIGAWVKIRLIAEIISE